MYIQCILTIMKARINKWGNSLALRIPKNFAEEIGLSDGSQVDIILKDDAITIRKSSYGLDELIKGIKKSNIHKETQTGEVTGNEKW